MAICEVPIALPAAEIVMRKVLCVMTKSVLYQRVFLFLWIYHVILMLVTLLYSFYLLFEALCKPWRVFCLKRRLNQMPMEEHVTILVQNRTYSEWLLLCKFGKVSNNVSSCNVLCYVAIIVVASF